MLFNIELKWEDSDVLSCSQVGNRTSDFHNKCNWFIYLNGKIRSNRLYSCSSITEAIREIKKIIECNITAISQVITFIGKDESIIELNLIDPYSVINVILSND